LHDHNELRGEVPDDGEVEQHVGDGDQVLEEREPTKGYKDSKKIVSYQANIYRIALLH